MTKKVVMKMRRCKKLKASTKKKTLQSQLRRETLVVARLRPRNQRKLLRDQLNSRRANGTQMLNS